jgi:hypothetical protein
VINPEDRTQRPPDTRDLQLLVVHLGTTGEAGLGLPQFTDKPHPETYLVWGRGDLGYEAMGNWNIPHIWVGDGGRRAGPASDQLYFRLRVLGPTHLQVGIRFDLDTYPPPWEIEIAFTCPDDTIPWNFALNLGVWDEMKQTRKGWWHPGVQNIPGEKRHRHTNQVFGGGGLAGKTSYFNLAFEEDPPESIMAAKPLYMLIQIVDRSHVRLGFRASREDPWYLSKRYDVTPVLGGPIGMFDQHAWSTVTGERWGAPPGGPMYQRFLVDYIYYRFGLSAE